MLCTNVGILRKTQMTNDENLEKTGLLLLQGFVIIFNMGDKLTLL